MGGGGKGGGGSAPPPPDPAATARAQGAANKEAAVAQANINMVNQVTPFGRLEYTQRGTASDGTPQYTATQTLSPQQQAIADQAQAASLAYGETGNQLMGRVRNMLGTPVDLNALGTAPTYDTNYRQSQRDALLQRMQPEFDRQRQAIETQLANQGITAGSQAYDNAFRPYYQALNDAQIAADLNAGNLAGAEYGRQYGARQNAINEAYLPRTQELNTLAALMSGTQMQGPQFVNTPQTGVQPADVTGATALAYQGQLANYNAQQQANNAMMGGLAGLGGAALGGWASTGFKKFW